MDTLYYDGQCPLCQKEIGWLKKQADAQLAFQNVHELEDDHQPTQAQLLQTLHLYREHQGWITGVEATLAAWSHTRLSWLFQPLNWPGIRWLSHRVYRYWAKQRYHKRYCNTQCRPQP